VTYRIQLIWQDLTTNNLKKLDRTKARFLKTVLCSSKYAPTRQAYTLAGTMFIIEDIKETFNLPETTPYHRVL
jgi:hypothetical protein